MRKTDQEADDALAYIWQRTAAPIEQFLESVAAARLEQDRNLCEKHTVGPAKLDLRRVAEGLRRAFEDLVSSLRATLNLQIFIRISQRRSRNRS